MVGERKVMLKSSLHLFLPLMRKKQNCCFLVFNSSFHPFLNPSSSSSQFIRMEEHLVLLMEGLKLEDGKTNLQQSTTSASGLASLRMNMDNIGSTCRICQDEDKPSNMESPCSCRGSLKLAHRKCVQKWCDAKGDIVCEICRQQFKPGYKAPPPRFYYNGVGTNVRGTAPENNRLVVRTDDGFLGDGLEFPVPSSTSFICCQIVAIIFTGLIVLRHALPILVDGTGDYSLSLFTMKTIGILMPMCVVFKAFTTIKRLRRQHGAYNESPRWVHVL